MEPTQEIRDFAESFAAAVVAKDYAAAHRMLAPWLRSAMSVDELRAAIEAEVRETLEINALPTDLHPARYHVSGNSSSIEDLRSPRSWSPAREIAAEVTPENFRHWMVIQFEPGEPEDSEIDAYMDLWMVVVEGPDGHEIGYFEMEDPD